MIYNLKHSIEVRTEHNFFKIESIEFLPLRGKHILATDTSLDGLLEDFRDVLNINTIINDTITDLKFSASGNLQLEEKGIFRQTTLAILDKHPQRESTQKAVMYNKIDKLIANIYFAENDGSSLAQGITSKGEKVFLEKKDYDQLFEDDIISIRNLFKEKKK